MHDYDDFLVEIHTEELPPKALLRLAKSFLQEITTRLTKAELTFGEARFFATPRRLAILVKKLIGQQEGNCLRDLVQRQLGRWSRKDRYDHGLHDLAVIFTAWS